MRVLLVAPRTDLLLVDEEVQDILSSGLEVTPMLGTVTQAELTRALRTDPYDVLWLATHGSNAGVVLSDGPLSASALAALVRDRIKTVILNSCESLMVAQQIQNETAAEVVATVAPVPDAEAYRTGSLFADWLARTGDVAAAFQSSRPGGNRIYVHLANTGRSVVENKGAQAGGLSGKVDRIERILDGDEDLGIRGMREELHGLRDDMNVLLRRTEAVPYQFPIYLIVVFNGLVIAGLLMNGWRSALGMEAMAGYAVIVALVIMASILMATVLKLGPLSNGRKK